MIEDKGILADLEYIMTDYSPAMSNSYITKTAQRAIEAINALEEEIKKLEIDRDGWKQRSEGQYKLLCRL